MTKLILAISPDKILLDQISAHLQEGGRFQVFGVTSGKEALTLAAKQTFDIAILDAEANDLPFLPLTRELVGMIPSLKLLIYPPNNNVHHPLLNGVVANGYLNKPFFGPEVNEKISRTLNENGVSREPVSSETNLARLWVENPESGLHQLEQLLASTSASAGLLLIHGRVIAASGALGDESSQNVVNFLTRYWTNIQSGELFRYLKMDREAKNYLVYATPLFTDVAFALIYHTNISLIEIRGEVTSIRNALLSRYANTSALRSEFLPSGKEFPVADIAPLVTAVTPSPANQPREDAPVAEMNTDDLSIQTTTDQSTDSEINAGPIAAESTEVTNFGNDESAATEEELEEDQQGLNDLELNRLDSIMNQIEIPEPEVEETQAGLSDEELANLDSLLANMPVPDPEVEFSVEPALAPEPLGEWLVPTVKESIDGPEDQEGVQTPVNHDITQPLHQIEQAAPKEAVTAPLPHQPEESHLQPTGNFPDFDFQLPWETNAPADEHSALTPPPLPTVSAEAAAERSVAPAFSNPDAIVFEYQLLLVPGNPQQFITHDLANLLNRQLPRLHQSSGWQCTRLSIRPLYLQWSALLPMNSCLADMIQEIKERTEIQIFAASPALLRTHPDGKFWAPGYFAVSGSQPLSNRLINDYLSFFRQTFPNQIPG